MEITIAPTESTTFTCQSSNRVTWYNENDQVISTNKQLRVKRAGTKNEVFECVTSDDKGNVMRALATMYVKGKHLHVKLLCIE